jgi:hypothetical protein
MSYLVQLKKIAKEDIDAVYDYIAQNLREPMLALPRLKKMPLSLPYLLTKTFLPTARTPDTLPTKDSLLFTPFTTIWLWYIVLFTVPLSGNSR